MTEQERKTIREVIEQLCQIRDSRLGPLESSLAERKNSSCALSWAWSDVRDSSGILLDVIDFLRSALEGPF